MGYNSFVDVEKENENKKNTMYKEIEKDEKEIFYTVILSHDELKQILKARCPYPQGEFLDRLRNSKRIEYLQKTGFKT